MKNKKHNSQTGPRWQEGDSNANKHALQMWYAEEHLWTHNASNLWVDRLQQQKTNKSKKMSNKYLIKCSLSVYG